MKFIQITATETVVGEENSGTLYALADDGTLWMMIDPWEADAEWTQLATPPWGGE